MPTLSFEIRNMETEERGVAEFADTEAALEWLGDRPHLIEVLGPAQQDLDPVLEASLRKAMRPLDESERARRQELDEARDAARRAKLLEMNRRAQREAEALPAGQGASQFVLRWERGRGLWIDDDPSATIPDSLAGAALEWIRERDRWAHPRKQHVASATLRIVAGEARLADRIADTSEFATMPGLSDDEIM